MAAEPRRPHGIDIVATILGVSAVVLPVGGFLVRWVAYAFGKLNVDSVTDIALAAPIGLLAWNGFFAFFGFIGYLVAVPFYFRMVPIDVAMSRLSQTASKVIRDRDTLVQDAERLKADLTAARQKLRHHQETGSESQEESHEESHQDIEGIVKDLEHRSGDIQEREKQLRSEFADLEKSEDWKKLEGELGSPLMRLLMRPLKFLRFPGWVAVVLGGTIQVILMIFVYEWPSAIIPLIGWLLTIVVIPWWAFKTGRLTVGMTASAVVVLLLFSAIGSGLAGNVAGEAIGSYSFRPGTGLTNGNYVLLGDSGLTTYLNPCGTDKVVSVEGDEIAHVDWHGFTQIPNGPSLWQHLVNHRALMSGFRTGC